MNNLNEIFDPVVMNALGWTLIHSLWQGLALFLVVFFVLRLLPRVSSSIRYLIACMGVTAQLAAGVATFILLAGADDNNPYQLKLTEFGQTVQDVMTGSSTDLISMLVTQVESNMPLVVMAWIAGAALFGVRMLGGWWYIDRIRRQSSPIAGPLHARVSMLARQLGITRVVALAETALVKTPMVIGYFKPVILLPAGMIGGLTTAQVEAILLHELAHIRRHDFLINIVQSLVEVVYFFNPFVWMISNVVRKEREYCCDDTVIDHHQNAIDYARALASLEETRVSGLAPAVPLGGDKNHLLKRIRRIMERSLNTPTRREKIIALALTVAGFACASWLTIGRDYGADNSNSVVTAPDTLKKNKKEARYERRSVTTYDEKGQPHEKVEERFEGDEELRPLLAPDDNFEFPDHPADIFAIPVIPHIPPVEPMLFDAFRDFGVDSVPGRRHFMHRDWDEFNDEFEKEFRSKFKDFYEKHGEELGDMMKELQERFESPGAARELQEFTEMAKRDAERFREQFHHFDHSDIAADAREEAMRARELAMEQLEKARRAQELSMEELERMQEERAGRMRELEEEMREMESRIHAFESALKEELVRDGYIQADEKIRNINWDEDGEITINGIKIREEHVKKYNELHKKYLGGSRGHFRHAE